MTETIVFQGVDRSSDKTRLGLVGMVKVGRSWSVGQNNVRLPQDCSTKK